MEDTQTIFQQKASLLTKDFILNCVCSKVASEVVLGDYLAEDVTLNGGSWDFQSQTADNLREILFNKQSITLPLVVLKETYHCQEVSPDVCVITVEYELSNSPDDESDSVKKRQVLDCKLTVVCQDSEEGVRISHLHHSFLEVSSPSQVVNLEGTSSVLPKELVEKVEGDSLTGLYNRSTMIEKIEEELSQDLAEEAALLMVDIDDFKLINDTYGHINGDAVLQEIAARINRSFRRSDIKGRLGGDEFMVMMRNIPGQQFAMQRAEYLCQSLSSIKEINGQDCQVSCSVGIAMIPRHGKTFDELYEKADVALYRAKELGKNQYVAYEEYMKKTPKASSMPAEKQRQEHKKQFEFPTWKRSALPKKVLQFITVGFYVAAISLFAGICLGYMNYMRNMIQQDSTKHLEVLSDQMVTDFGLEIERNKDIIKEISDHYQYMTFQTKEEWLEVMRKDKENGDFSDFYFQNGQGNSLSYDGQEKVLEEPGELDKTETVSTYIEPTNGELSILFTSEISPLTIDGVRYDVVTAEVGMEKWSRFFKSDSFQGEMITKFILPDGTYILDNGVVRQGDNFFSEMMEVSFRQRSGLDIMRLDMLEERAGTGTFSDDSGRYFLSYMPAGFRNWYLVTIVPIDAVNDAITSVFKATVMICLALTVLFILIIFCFAVSQKVIKQRLWRIAYIDTVTGGANRSKFELDAKELVRKGTPYVLAYGNIRQFKMFNDRFGKEEADGILKTVHMTIEDMLDKEECCARLTADNFAILMKNISTRANYERLERLSVRCAVLESKTGQPYGVQFRFGVYYLESSEEDVTQMLDKAHMALKDAANTDVICYLYQPEMMEKLHWETVLKDRIPRALEEKEFCIYLQPSVRIKDGVIFGAEALVRWVAPDEGMIFPDEFIPLAERCGFIRDIDLYVFAEVCQTICRWIEEGQTPVIISFNLSRAQLRNPNFLDSYKEILEKYPAPPCYLEFEFTETLMYENMDLLNRAADEIREMGCKCAIDDFGNGYSSLGLLSKLQADTLKLDRSFFLAAEDEKQRGHRVIESVIHLAQELGMSTIAEGVESLDQVEMLKTFGCDLVQGYVFSKPLPVQQFEQKLYQQGGYGLEPVNRFVDSE